MRPINKPIASACKKYYDALNILALQLVGGSYVITRALLALLVSHSAFAGNKTNEFKAKICASWLVDGMPYIKTAAAIQAGDAAPAIDGVKHPVPYVLRNLGLPEAIPARWTSVAQFVSAPKLIHTFGISQGGALDNENYKISKDASITNVGYGSEALVQVFKERGAHAENVHDLTRVANRSQDLVVSHMQLPHMNRDARIALLQESFRVLKPTGSARHSLLIPNVRAVLGDHDAEIVRASEQILVAAIEGLVKEALGDSGYQLSVFIDEPKMRLSGIPTSTASELLPGEGVSYQQLRDEAKDLEKGALNVLIVLRRPDDSSFSFEGWLGR